MNKVSIYATSMLLTLSFANFTKASDSLSEKEGPDLVGGAKDIATKPPLKNKKAKLVQGIAKAVNKTQGQLPSVTAHGSTGLLKREYKSSDQPNKGSFFRRTEGPARAALTPQNSRNKINEGY